MSTHRSWHLIAFAAAVAWPGDAHGQPPGERYVCVGDECFELAEHGRTLGGHRYVRSALVDWAFITSSFGAISTGGLFRLDDPVATRIVGSDDPRLEMIVVSQTFSGTVAATPWLAFSVAGSAGSLTAIDRRSAVAVGAHVLLGFQAGAALRILRSENIQVTALGDFGWAHNDGITPALLPGSPRVDRRVWSIRPALAAAFTLSETVGLQLGGSLAWRDVEDQPEKPFAYSAGAGFTIALDPVMLLLAGSISHQDEQVVTPVVEVALEGQGGTRGSGELGVYYHGRRDLDLGVGFVIDVGDDSKRYIGNVRMTYFF